MTDDIIFRDENNSTSDNSISKGAGFGIFQEFRGRLNARQTFSTPNNNTQKQEDNDIY
jgi:hypothetical protein